jgi:hypothetical protein
LIIHVGYQILPLRLSFKNARELRSRIGQLPPCPQWRRQELSLGPSFPTKAPLYLYYRDAAECVATLYGNPLLFRHIRLHPREVVRGDDEDARIYHDWITGEEAMEMQARTV